MLTAPDTGRMTNASEATSQPPLMFTPPREWNPDGRDDYTTHAELRSTEEANLKELKASLDVLLEIANAPKHKLSCMTGDQDITEPDIIEKQEQKVEETIKLAVVVQKRYDLTVETDGINAKMLELHPSILAELEKMNIRHAAGKNSKQS